MLRHVLILVSFGWQIIFCYTYACIYIHTHTHFLHLLVFQLMNVWVVSAFWAFWLTSRSFSVDIPFISPSRVPKSRIVSSAVTPCPALVRRRAAHTLQLNVRVWFPFFFHHVLLSAFFDRVLWWTQRPVVPSVIPLMANDGEHLFLCLLPFIFLLWRNSRFYKFCSLTSECS